MENKTDMAMIPFIAHLARMHKAEMRERRLKRLLILSNVFWLIVCLLWRVVG